MPGPHAIRGARIGAGPMGEEVRGQAAPRFQVSYWCAGGHETRPSFVRQDDIEIPETWDCPRCGLPAGQDREHPPSAPSMRPYKTHMAYVKERRSDAEGEAILDEALTVLRTRRGESPEEADPSS